MEAELAGAFRRNNDNSGTLSPVAFRDVGSIDEPQIYSLTSSMMELPEKSRLNAVNVTKGDVTGSDTGSIEDAARSHTNNRIRFVHPFRTSHFEFSGTKAEKFLQLRLNEFSEIPFVYFILKSNDDHEWKNHKNCKGEIPPLLHRDRSEPCVRLDFHRHVRPTLFIRPNSTRKPSRNAVVVEVFPEGLSASQVEGEESVLSRGSIRARSVRRHRSGR